MKQVSHRKHPTLTGKPALHLQELTSLYGRRSKPSKARSRPVAAAVEPDDAHATTNRGGPTSTSAPELVRPSWKGRKARRRPPKPTTSQVRLNEAIVAAPSAWEILHLVQTAAPEDLSLVNTVTAFQRLAKRSISLAPEEKRQLQRAGVTKALADAVMSYRQDWGGYAVANLAWAHETLRHGHPDLPDALKEKYLERLGTMVPAEVGGTLSSLFRCGVVNSAYLEALRPALLQWLDARRMPVNERCLNGLLWTYAKCGQREEAAVKKLAAATKLTLQEQDINRRGLANLVWAFARIEHLDSELFEMLAAKALPFLPAWPPTIPSRKAGVVAAFDLANMGWGFGRAYFLFVGLSEPEFGRDDGLYYEYLQRVPLRALVIKRIARNLLPVAEHLTETGLSSVMYGLAIVRHYHPELIAKMASILRQQSGTLQHLTLAVSFWSLSTLRYDSPDTYEALAQRMLELMEDSEARLEIHEQDLNMVLLACAFANLGHLPHCRRLVRKLAELVSERGVDMLHTPQGLANVAWGLACLGMLDGALLRQICVRLAKQGDVPSHALTQIYQADLSLQLSRLPITRDTAAKDVSEFLEECFSLGRLKLASRRHWSQLLTQTWRSVTDLHWQVATALKELGGSFRVEYEAEDYSVDIALENERIAIEVDGPTHFMRNTSRPLGFHAFKARLLSLRGWKVVNIPYFEWNKAQTNEARREYLTGLLAAVGWSPPTPELQAGEAGVSSQDFSPAAVDTKKEHSGEDPRDPDTAEATPLRGLSVGDKLALLRHKDGASRQKMLLDRALRRKC